MIAFLSRALGVLVRRKFLGELGWVLLGLPLTLVCVIPLFAGLTLGTALSPLFLGLPLLAGVLMGARRLGAAHRRLARSLLGLRIAEPAAPRLEPGLWSWVKTRLGDRIAWRTQAYLLLRLPLAALGLAVGGTMLLYGLSALSFPLTWFLTPKGTLPLFDIHSVHWAGTLPIGVLGAVLVPATPWVLRVVTAPDRTLARSLLGPTTLTERVLDLEQRRTDAIDDATTRLRRIERDLHDGAQAQLVALAMKLGIARDELAGDAVDLDTVRGLLTTAHGNAKQALTELRDLARGIRPPALDAGLEVALATLAARSAIEVRLHFDLPDRPSPAIETLLYFSAAELVTNAAKHGGAAVVHLELRVAGDFLRLTVSDEGTGGALLTPGGGLAGVAERVRTVDGALEIESPAGGPTVITALVPNGG
ncbi:sensor histidine kinase [Amycolatopsis rhizosphaerae]|uniref:histidine kinase n=1 Tax=Amycolatopsis rhizosphaerae TaxID=2053003 RepID=A0A558C026_9PSEU|nr:sensor histidine kinase [Amycolatopsis rhizosphaerae]TVT42097.1 sensor histidine kinase [Amycolatopsis rhizosphaerae]